MVAVVAVVGGTMIGLWQAGVFRSPPSQRDVTLPFLASTGWDPDVFVSYTNLGPATQLLRSGLQDADAAAAHARVTADVVISQRGSGATDDAFANAATIGSISPSAAVSGLIALQQQLAHSQHATISPLAGLPQGWRGMLGASASNGTIDVELAGAADERLVWISLHANAGAASRLAQVAGQLASGIAGWGIPRFTSAVAR